MCSFDFEVTKQPWAYIYRNWSYFTELYKFQKYTDNTSLDQSITTLLFGSIHYSIALKGHDVAEGRLSFIIIWMCAIQEINNKLRN